jgi:CubicO group peptidase (beta-lactamase class C family)
VLEPLYGDLWAVYIPNTIWTPLGMTRSFVGVSPYLLADLRAASYTTTAVIGVLDTTNDARAEAALGHRAEPVRP